MNTKWTSSMGFSWYSRSARFLGLLAFAASLAPIAAAQTVVLPVDPPLHVERQRHTATPLVDGAILIVGGESATGPTDQSEFYDPVTKAFSNGLLSVVALADHTATLLADGRVLVIGGRDASGPLGSTELYDPAAGEFSDGPELNVARAGHSATVLQDGRILVVGGDGAGSAEIYDPGTEHFTLLDAQLGTRAPSTGRRS